MEGNLHVPFLGGLAGAIPPGYPVGDGNITLLPDLRDYLFTSQGYMP